MITIYSKTRRKSVEDVVTVADRALAALRIAIRRIEADGEPATLERARLEELQTALAATAPTGRAKPAKARKPQRVAKIKPIKMVFV